MFDLLPEINRNVVRELEPIILDHVFHYDIIDAVPKVRRLPASGHAEVVTSSLSHGAEETTLHRVTVIIDYNTLHDHILQYSLCDRSHIATNPPGEA